MFLCQENKGASEMKIPIYSSCKKWTSLFGTFLITLFLSTPWLWGNLSIYVLSFVHNLQPSARHLNAPLVLPLHFFGNCLGSFIAGFLVRCLGKRLTVVLGAVLFSSGWIASYFILRTSLLAMSFMLGLLVSVSGFFLEGTAILYAAEWSRDDMGLTSSIPLCGLVAGPVVINQFVTLQANPNNLSPDVKVGPSMFFSQEEVIAKVPSLFVTISVSSLILNTLGILLIRQNPKADLDQDVEVSPAASYGSNVSSQQDVTNGDTAVPLPPDNLSSISASAASATKKSQDDNNMLPSEVIHTSTLRYLWLFFLAAEMPLVLLSNYYKAYGQLFIHDDLFLTNLSTALLVGIIVSRVVWGLILDRLGFKSALALFFSSATVAVFLLYFSPFVNKWTYAAAVILVGAVGSHQYLFFSYASLKAFGRENFLLNNGLVTLPSVIAAIGLPFLIEELLQSVGWFGVFGFCSSCTFVGLVVVVTGFNDT